MSELDLHFGISDPDGVAADLEVLVGSTADQSADTTRCGAPLSRDSSLTPAPASHRC
jgi:hypothetical protein